MKSLTIPLSMGLLRKGRLKLLLATANRSILVIEDIDCSVDLPERRHGDGRKQADVQEEYRIYFFIGLQKVFKMLMLKQLALLNRQSPI